MAIQNHNAPVRPNATQTRAGRVLSFPGAGGYTPGTRTMLSTEHLTPSTSGYVAGAPLQVMTFPEAAGKWLEWRSATLHPNTQESYQNFIRALCRFFGDMRLRDIQAVHLRAYQDQRLGNLGSLWKRTAGPSAINHELNTLQQILRHADLWKPLHSFYKPLPLPRWTPPRVMTPEEETRLHATAKRNPTWELAYIAACITANTTASGCELRGLRLRDVWDLDGLQPAICIPSESAKNEHRGRVIPLNDDALPQVRKALERAHALGSRQPDHYLFPFRVKRNTYDPTRPASRYWIRAQFEKLRVAAGLPWLRPHDLRHHSITELLERGVPDQTVMSIAGHVSKQMLEHYAHIRIDAKAEALRTLVRQAG